MDCPDAREQLLQLDQPAPPGLLADHLVGCESCRKLVQELRELDQAWRNLPLPVAALGGAERFLKAHPEVQNPAKPRSHRKLPLRWLAAASVLLAGGLWAGFVGSVPKVHASTDVVERLVEWNLKLASASDSDRDRIFGEQAASLAGEVEAAPLTVDDRELARSLLDDAPRIVQESDPLSEIDHFDRLADRLFRRMSHASGSNDPKRVGRYARLYKRVIDLGIDPKVDLLEASDALDFEKKRKLERLILRDSDRRNTLIELLERAPDSSRKEIKKALGIPRQKPKTVKPDGTKKPRKS